MPKAPADIEFDGAALRKFPQRFINRELSWLDFNARVLALAEDTSLPHGPLPATVVVQAPDHVVENEKALAKAGDDPKARRKIVRKKPPEGFVSWGEPTFERLVAAARAAGEPERRPLDGDGGVLLGQGDDGAAQELLRLQMRRAVGAGVQRITLVWGGWVGPVEQAVADSGEAPIAGADRDSLVAGLRARGHRNVMAIRGRR